MNAELIQSAVLGVVQGLTEFLPVSSSGHLVTIPWIFGWHDLGPTFDVALHLGTLLALLLYFWKDWLDIIKNWQEPLLWLIAIGCVPAAIAGFKYEKYFDTVFRSPLIIGIFMIGMGLLMMLAERYGRKLRSLETLNLGDSLGIGFAQVLALMPGVSRSGITVTAGLFGGLKRETAARYSFLLAMPITFGAGLLKMHSVLKTGIPQEEQMSFILGIVMAAVVGYLAIRFLLNFLKNHSLYIFVWYRLFFGALLIFLYFRR